MSFEAPKTNPVIRRWRSLALTVIALGAFPATAAASTYTVTGTPDSGGACVATTCPSLRAAVDAANANPGSTIVLGAGTFTLGNGPGAPVGTGELQISAQTTITGAGAGSTVIEQTDGEHRVIDNWNSPPVTINDVTITGGTLGSGASQPGAAIFSVAPLVLNGVTVTGNRETGSTDAPVSNGCCEAVGAITSLSALTISNSVITDNHATADPGTTGTAGGQAVAAIEATDFSQITITDSTISDNTSTSGAGGSSLLGPGGHGGDAYGALFVIDGAPTTITGSTFSDNTATAGAGGAGLTGGSGGSSYGGAVLVPDATLQISSSTFNGNSAHAGAGGAGTAGPGGAGGNVIAGAVGGGSRTGGNNWILNTTFYGNAGSGGAGGTGTIAGVNGYTVGGGLAEDTASAITIVSSTFDANVVKGAGVSAGGNIWDLATRLTLGGDIFSAGVAGSGNDCKIAAVETDDGYNLESSRNQCGLSVAKHDLISADPVLLPLADNGGPVATMALGAGSAAIKAGGTCIDYGRSGDPPLATDARGVPRASPCDIGAFETEPVPARSGGGSGPSSISGSTPSGSARLPPLTISRVIQSAHRWRVKTARPVGAADNGKVPVGTTFKFTLGSAATVKLRFTQLVRGHKRKRRCIAGSKRTAPRCHLEIAVGQLAVAGAHEGENAIIFQGRMSSGAQLKPGSYTVAIIASDGTRHARSRALGFTIVRG